MPGETDLETLLATLAPHLEAGEYVFASVPEAERGRLEEIEVFATVREEEGVTLVLLRERAVAVGLTFEGTFRRITLRVHSSLEAVGLTAAVSGCLAEAGISANVVAGYHHDHVFVPSGRSDDALAALRGLSGAASQTLSERERL